MIPSIQVITQMKKLLPLLQLIIPVDKGILPDLSKKELKDSVIVLTRWIDVFLLLLCLLY